MRICNTDSLGCFAININLTKLNSMIRQTAYGIAFASLVLASGLASAPIAGYESVHDSTPVEPVLIAKAQQMTASLNPNELEKSVFTKINQYRESKGLSKLRLDSRISQQARIHSQNMANRRVPFSHNGFERRVKALPIKFRSAAENVAFNQGYDDPVGEAVRGWINSHEHHVNIKGKYNLTGVGVAINRDGEVYLTQIFIYQ